MFKEPVEIKEPPGGERRVRLMVGDKVRIITPVHELKERKVQVGTVTNINGSYVLVKPKYCTWERDCLRNEVEKISVKEYNANKER